MLRRRVAAMLAVAVVTTVGMTFGSAAEASPAPEPVTATLGITGVSATNCPGLASIGGTDVSVVPGQQLRFRSSLVGITVYGKGALSGLLGDIASLNGALVIDPGSSHPIDIGISTESRTVPSLAPGDHRFVWRVDSVTLLKKIPLLGSLLGKVPLSLGGSGSVGAGASLTYSGTIHVTDAVTAAAADCGLVELPEADASAHVGDVSASAHVGKTPSVTVQVGKSPSPAQPTDVTQPSDPSQPSDSAHPTRPAEPDSTDTKAPAAERTESTGQGPGHQPTADRASSNSTRGPALPADTYPSTSPTRAGGADGARGGLRLMPLVGLQAAAAGDGTARVGPAADDSSQALVADRQSDGEPTAMTTHPASTGDLLVILAVAAILTLTMVAVTYARLHLLRKE